MSTALELPLHCTFDADDWRKLAQYWFPIAASADVGEQPFKATLLDEQLVAYRVGGELVVARDVCAHRGVPLSLGKADGQGVVCPYHGLRYGSGGVCNLVPSSPNERIPSRLRLMVYAAAEQYGLIWVCLSPKADSAPDVPNMPY